MSKHIASLGDHAKDPSPPAPGSGTTMRVARAVVGECDGEWVISSSSAQA